ncbi:hypothetical protein HDV06_001638 [Boothiomyces sp. JEL0866]|nr:hypothetical protein HDV06_001638 [Boothiomyces sp. JEL0866]
MTVDYWFQTRVESFISELETTVKSTLELTANSKPCTIAVSSVNSNKLKGFVTLSNTMIIKGELTIKSPAYNRGHSTTLKIDPNSPIDLVQLKTIHNCLSMAFVLVKRLDARSVQAMVDILSHLTSLVQQAITSIAAPNLNLMFPKAYHPTFVESPTDCAVDFVIQESNLITSVNCLANPDNAIEQALSQLKNNTTVKVNGKDVHVVDKFTVDSPLPLLSELKTGLGTIEALCDDFIRKYNAIYQ